MGGFANAYDWLGRLTSATNPENGTTGYEYDDNGNLITRTDALGRATAMAYDHVDRIASKSYSDGTPAVRYCYDGQVASTGGDQCTAGSGGNPARHLTGAGTALSRTAYTYDLLGRPVSSKQTTDGIDYPFVYTWNPANELASLQYPSGHTVSYCFDTAGRPTGARKGASGDCTIPSTDVYAGNGGYADHGALAQLQLGNGLWERAHHNSRLQPDIVSLGTALGATDRWGITLDYGSTSNNGNVLSQTITAGTAAIAQAYTYDGVNRLKTASEGGPWSQTYVYDRWGNRALKSDSYLPDVGLTPQVQADDASLLAAHYGSTNRLAAGSPDAAGNLQAQGAYAFTYDAENRLTTSTINQIAATYSYDGEGRRVKKAGVETTVYVYDARGQLAAEYSDQTNPDAGVRYLTADHLGSTRVETDGTGAVARRHDYLPFGEDLVAGVGQRTTALKYPDPGVEDGQKMRFTGQLRDAETGLDYFGARYMSSAQGRFTSPDLVNVTNDRLLSPSSTLNKYVYGGNNPLKYTDPDGRDITLFYESGYPTGHIMMAAYNQQTNDFAFLSVGPQTHDGILTNPFEGVAGTSEFKLPQTADDLRQNFSSLTIQTSPEVAQQAIDAIRNGAGTGNWALLGNNCTSSCAKVLKDIGLYPGSNGGLAWTPDKLWANLNLLYGKKRPPAFVRSILGSTIGGSPLMTPSPQPGTDFGNPRYGMNVFDWVMLQLKAPSKACVTVTDSATGTTSTECH